MAESHLAAAVSNAGGFGIIGAANAPAEVVRNYIREAKEMTDKPFGVNIMLMSPYAADIAQVVVEEKVVQPLLPVQEARSNIWNSGKLPISKSSRLSLP